MIVDSFMKEALKAVGTTYGEDGIKYLFPNGEALTVQQIKPRILARATACKQPPDLKLI